MCANEEKSYGQFDSLLLLMVQMFVCYICDDWGFGFE